MAFEPQIGLPQENVEAMPVRLVGMGDAAGNMPSVPLRPSQKAGRVHKTINIDNQNSGQILYNVTNGKVLYIFSIVVSAYNTGAPARLRVKDNTTVKCVFHASGTGLGVLSGAVPLSGLSFNFSEPLQFVSSVVSDIPSGTLVYSVTLIGYEE